MNDTSGRWSYARQLYGHVYTAKIGTLSELVTAGDQFNQQHITLAGYEKETQTPADELAASRTARAAVFIRNDPARPTQTGELVGMLPAPKGKRFTMTEQQTLLSHGVATAYVESGVLRIQRDVTTYRKNAYGVTDSSGDTVDAINSAQWGAGAYDAYGTGIPARGYTPYPAVDPAQSNNASGATGPNPFMINKASAPKVDGEIKVSFMNSPPGMRVMETRSSGFDVSHDVGYTRFGR